MALLFWLLRNCLAACMSTFLCVFLPAVSHGSCYGVLFDHNRQHSRIMPSARGKASKQARDEPIISFVVCWMFVCLCVVIVRRGFRLVGWAGTSMSCHLAQTVRLVHRNAFSTPVFRKRFPAVIRCLLRCLSGLGSASHCLRALPCFLLLSRCFPWAIVLVP